MAKEDTSDDGSGLGKVEITVVVVPGLIQATLTKLRPRTRIRAWLASAGVVAAIMAGAIIAVSSSGGSRSPFNTHRSHGVWVRKIEVSSWTCPSARLPYRVAIGLHLCGPNIAPPQAVASPSPGSH